MKKRKVIWLAAVGVAALTCMGAVTVLKGQRSSGFRTVRADRATIESAISATGNLNAVVTVQVGTQVSGNISALYADFNSRVTKGQLVARIDPEIFQAKVTQAQANVDAARAAVGNAQAAFQKAEAEVSNARAMLSVAQANLAKEKVNAADAKTKYDRQAALFSGGLISAQDRDTAQAALDAEKAAVASMQAQVQAASDGIRSAEAARDVARAQVTTAQAQVAQQAAALRQNQIDLEHTYIYAPVDGVVVSRMVDVGQTVAASLQAPTIFQIAQDLTKMQVDTNVDEADIGRVLVGQQANFTVDAYPGVVFQGAVREIRKAPINTQNVITYDVVVGVSNPDQKLFPGMTANVKVLTDRREEALRIPNSALRYRPADAAPQKNAAGMQTLWVANEDGKPTPVPVKLGITDGTYSEVVSGDLREGQQVIVGAATQVAKQSTPMTRGPRPF